VLIMSSSMPSGAEGGPPKPSPVDSVLRVTTPLQVARGERLPLYTSMVQDVPGDEGQIEQALKALAERGIAACATWRPGRGADNSLERALLIGRVQHRLGLRVNINAVGCSYTVCNGAPETAHLDEAGKPFFDASCAGYRKLGCPFKLAGRYPAIREQMAFFCKAYKEAGIDVDFVWTDWEIDGPIEWNEGWVSAKRCVVCRERIGDVDDFRAVQRAYRKIRSEIENTCYAGVLREHFPNVLVGNYAVYPNDGTRYWYDYFEVEPSAGVPVRMDQKAPYRPWVDEFTPCGYTYAMPVVYTWYRTWHWYDEWAQSDYRWFYNMLLTASNAGKSTPADVPIIPFVHWETTSPPKDADPAVKQFSRGAYQELLWHMLLRGHDTFFVWGNNPEQEVAPVHEVWAAALAHKAFLDGGVPVTFDVPARPGPVVSALRLGDRVLVRRTDFGDAAGPVDLDLDDVRLQVKPHPGHCQILKLTR
jgi:hypothetical protein